MTWQGWALFCGRYLDDARHVCVLSHPSDALQLLDHLDLGDMPRSTKNRFLFGDECFQAEERASDIAAAAGAASAATPATSAEKSNTLAPVKAKARADPKVSERVLPRYVGAALFGQT